MSDSMPYIQQTQQKPKSQVVGNASLVGMSSVHAADRTQQWKMANAGPGARLVQQYKALSPKSVIGKRGMPPMEKEDFVTEIEEDGAGRIEEEYDPTTLSSLLIPKKGKSKPKGLQVFIGTLNTAHLSRKTKNRAKKKRKLNAIHQLFNENPDTLQLLTLQEVNDDKVLQDLGGKVKLLSSGPILRTIGTAGTPKYSETYPLLGREDSEWKVTGVEVFHPRGFKPIPVQDGQEVIWRNFSSAITSADKRLQKKRYRPVVIYRLKNNFNQKLNVAVVHTTPSGAEFARQVVFGQVKNFLRYMNKGAGEGEHWIMLGDFYLTPEADVEHNHPETPWNKRNVFGLKFPDSVANLIKNAPKIEYRNLVPAHPISATSWPLQHQRSDDRKKMQIADFMITSKSFQQRAVGVFDVYAKGIWLVDWYHRNLIRWITLSDHVPVGGFFSTIPGDTWVKEGSRVAEKNGFPDQMREFEGLLSEDNLSDVRILNIILKDLRERLAVIHKTEWSKFWTPKLDPVVKKHKQAEEQLKQVSGWPLQITGSLTSINKDITAISEFVADLEKRFKITPPTDLSKKLDALLKFTKDDASFFVDPKEPVPAGIFNLFTHDLRHMSTTFLKLIGTVSTNVWPVERALGSSTTFQAFLDKLSSDDTLRQHVAKLKNLDADLVTIVIALHRYGEDVKVPPRLFGNLNRVRLAHPMETDPLDGLRSLGFTLELGSALAGIYRQLQLAGYATSSFDVFRHHVAEQGVTEPTTIADVLSGGNALLNAVQHSIKLYNHTSPHLTINVWLALPDGSLVEFETIAEKEGDYGHVALNLYHDVNRGFVSLWGGLPHV
jgi:hypothetical protein